MIIQHNGKYLIVANTPWQALSEILASGVWRESGSLRSVTRVDQVGLKESNDWLTILEAFIDKKIGHKELKEVLRILKP